MFFDKILTKIFGTANERAIKRLTPFVALISALEADIKALTDEQLREKTVEFRARIAKRSKALRTKRTRRERSRDARRWTSFCPRPLRWCARPAGARCRCATSTCS